jgi:CBS domain-containing protein
MLNRELAFVIKDQHPLILQPTDSVQLACHQMWERRVGAVLVTDENEKLVGIFTSRDAVWLIAEGKNANTFTLADAMTANPDTISPELTVIDALRTMSDCGYRHLPIVANGKVLGIVSRGDFKGDELSHLEKENHLWESIG